MKKAIAFFERSAKQGISDSQYILGRCYFFGDGVEKDVEKALQLFEKAAEERHSGSQRFLGRCYLFGEGVEKDVKKQFHFLKNQLRKKILKHKDCLAFAISRERCGKRS